MLHWETISGGLLILVGAVLVGIGQKAHDEVRSFSGVMRTRVVTLRQRLITARSKKQNSARPERQPTIMLNQAPSDVERVISQLQHGTLTATEKGQISAALSSETFPSERSEALPARESDVTEALNLAAVASSAVKRVGERGVLAMRFTGSGMIIAGIVVMGFALRYF